MGTTVNGIYTREDYAWAAGLAEGEGCFSSDNGFPRFTLRMIDRDVVARFAAIYGLRVQGPLMGTSPLTRQPAYAARTGRFEIVQHMAATMWPWLGERRRNRISELLTGMRETYKTSSYWSRVRQNTRRNPYILKRSN
jgi:hypothetical protein